MLIALMYVSGCFAVREIRLIAAKLPQNLRFFGTFASQTVSYAPYAFYKQTCMAYFLSALFSAFLYKFDTETADIFYIQNTENILT